MVRYEVVVQAAPELSEKFEEYMRRKHIPEILATGCFTHIVLQRAEGSRYRTSYTADTRADVERYLAEHTAAFRSDFQAHFPEGVAATREVWTDVEEWSR